MKRMNKKGFTIVELVIVIAVIAILAAVLIPTFQSVITKAKQSSALQQAKVALDVITAEEKGDIKDTYYFKSGDFVFKYAKGDKELTKVDAVGTGASKQAYTGDVATDIGDVEIYK